MQVSGQFYASVAVPPGTHSVGRVPDTVHAIEIRGKNLLCLPALEPRFFGSSARNLVTVPVTLFLLRQELRNTQVFRVVLENRSVLCNVP